MEGQYKDSTVLWDKNPMLGLVFPRELAMLLYVLKSSASGVGPSNRAHLGFSN